MGIDKRSMGTPYWFPVGGDALVVLGDDAGVKKFIVQDVNQVDVGYIDSLGNLWLAGSATLGSIIYDPSIPIVNPPAGKFLMYVDSDGIMHVIDESGNEVTYNFSETVEGSGGSVAVYEDVQSSLLYNQLFGSPLVNNVLGSDGDGLSITGLTQIGTFGDAIVDHVYLLHANVTANAKTSTTLPFAEYAGASQLFDESVIVGIGETGNYYGLSTAITGTLNFIKTFHADTSNILSMGVAPFDLTKLGTYTAEQVLMLASLGVTVTTSDSWVDIASATGYVSTIWDTLVSEHISGYSPSEVHEVVNRGNNLAFIDTNDLIRSTVFGVTLTVSEYDYDSSDGSFTMVQSAINNGMYFKTKVSPILNILAFTEGVGFDNVMMRLLDSDGDVISNGTAITGWNAISSNRYNKTAFVTSQEIDLSGIGEVAEVEFVIYDDTNTGTATTITGIRLNAGSTALDYSAPLNSPFIAGSLSENLFINGNGEKAVGGWEIGDSATEFSHDGTEFILNNGDASTAYVTRSGFGGVNRTFAINVTDITDSNLRLRVTTEAEMDNDSQLTADGWVWTASAYYQKDVSATGLIANYFEGLTSIAWIVKDSTLNDTVKFKEVQFINGDYTLTEIEAKPYVSFAPLLLHNTGDGTDNKSDRLYQVGSDVMLEKNNEVDADYNLGDDAIDTTALTSGTLTVGRQYTIVDWITADDFTNVGGTNVDGNVFIATGTTPTTWTNSSELNAHNVWQSSSPETINATEKGWALTALNQPADNGQNHQIFDGNMISTTKHLLGLGAAFKNLTDVVQTKADISAIPYIGRCAVTNVGDLAANSETYYSYSDMPNFRDFVNNIAEIYKYSMDVGVNYVDFYPNGAVVSTGGSIVSAGTLLFDYVVGEMVDVSSEVL